MGRFGFEALGCSAVLFLGRRRELHHVLAFLRLVEFQRQRRDRGTASVGRMDRPRLMAKMVHGFALRHARRTRPLRPGVTIGVQAASFYPQHPATPAKLAGARIRVPRIHVGEEITFLRQLEQQLFERRPDAQEAFSTGLFARELAAAKVDRLVFEIDLIGMQAGDVGLRSARFPEHFVVELPLHVALAVHDPAMFLLGDGGELPFPHLGPRGVRHDGHEQPAEMQRVVVQSAQVMMRRVARPLVLEDGQQMRRLRVHQRKPAQMGERAAAKSRGLPFARRFDTRYRVMLHHVGPGAREQIGRLGREISLGHRPVELRLRGRLVASREQLLGLRAVGRSEAFGSSGDFVSRIKVAARAAEHPESFLHDLGSNA